ncbi:hypothetical protein GOBAR_AA20264 [Gossypium barbadense]|uniref:Uncharacterized protein n=1 Tax=Gossypium barbadense TaxID=3634 RepID=A0A2P5XAN4_GOSBA|nr:hypothetical protein GOBAR_AA20264 [Gossypium barbadense]
MRVVRALSAMQEHVVRAYSYGWGGSDLAVCKACRRCRGDGAGRVGLGRELVCCSGRVRLSWTLALCLLGDLKVSVRFGGAEVFECEPYGGGSDFH